MAISAAFFSAASTVANVPSSRPLRESLCLDNSDSITKVLLLFILGSPVRYGPRHAALAHLLGLRALRLVPIDRRLAELAMQLAADLGLRGADAIYVATAHALRVPLVTLDQDQLSRTAAWVTARMP